MSVIRKCLPSIISISGRKLNYSAVLRSLHTSNFVNCSSNKVNNSSNNIDIVLSATKRKAIVNKDTNNTSFEAKDKIKATILSWKERRDTNSVIRALNEAKDLGMDLELKECIIGISACIESNSCSIDLPFWIFKNSRQQKITPVEVYEKMLKFCSHRKLTNEALEIIDDYKSNGYQITESIYATILNILAKSSNTAHNFKALQKYYDDYRTVSKTFGWRISAQIYIDLAISYCKHRQGQGVLDILHDMTNAHHEPSPHLCDHLLETALFYRDAKVLRVLSSWYSNHFHVRLEFGVLNRMLQVASSYGDGQLALVAFQMIAKNGYNASNNSYFCLVRALLRSDDMISAVEALQELETRNTVEMSEEDIRSYQNIKVMLVQNLLFSNSTGKSDKSSRLDDLYFALVDQSRKSKQIVPRIVLDSLIEAAGKLDLVDRAVATFQEYKTLFGVDPDVSSYNSLLSACSNSSRCSVNQLLSIFQDMETNGNISPSSESYSILLEALVNMNDLRVAGVVLEHMEEKKSIASGRSLRRLMKAAKNKNELELLESVDGLLKKHLLQN